MNVVPETIEAGEENRPEKATATNGNTSAGLHNTVHDVTHRIKSTAAHQLELMEEQTRKNEVIIQAQHSTKRDLVTKKAPLIRRIAAAVPRLYYFTTQLVFPLLLLIAMAFLFGWGLVTLEGPGEIEANDEALAGIVSFYARYKDDRDEVHKAIQRAPGTCLVNYDFNVTVQEVVQELITTPNQADLLNDLLQCATDAAVTQFPIAEFELFFEQFEPELSFNWISCDRADLTSTKPDLVDSDYDQQYTQYVEDFAVDFRRIYGGVDTHDRPDNMNSALAEATGSVSCKPHVAAGALFWFTVMTTIGYGNTAPSTQGGRMLIFVCGFITIIGFIGLNNTASNVLVIIVDDLLIRSRLPKFTKGLRAVTLWLCLLILWMLVLAIVFKAFIEGRSGIYVPLSDAYWFSYITTTTVGLGDLFIRHEEFLARDMLVIPLVILFAFVILGIFALKLVECLTQWFPVDSTLESVLEASRVEEPKVWDKTPRIVRRHSF